MEFSGKTAMITGAAVGIGRACAIRLAQEGAALLLLDRDAAALDVLQQELAGYGTPILACPCDVSDAAAVQQAVVAATERFGGVDILINNAAVWRSSKPFLELTQADWQQYLSVNVMGVVYCTQAVLGGMLHRGYGRIVNVASVAGVYGNANMVQYSASKGAVIAMTRALAKEVAAGGVLVNCVSPGSVSPSDIADIDHVQESSLSYLGRTGSDRENAELICFLASERASYIAGQNIQIDGCRRQL